MRTYSSLFLESVIRYPQRICIRRANGETFTYQEAGRIVAGIIGTLNGMGVRRGDRIVIFADQNYPAVFLYLACYTSGIICLPVGPRFSYGFMKDAARRVEAKKVYCDQANVSLLRENGEEPLHFGEGGPLSLEPRLSAEEALAFLRQANQDLFDSSVLKLMCTSGSTGKPNIVVRANRYFPIIEDAVWKVCRGESRRFLLAGSLTHGFAHTSLSATLAVGGEIAMPTLVDTEISLHEVRALDPNVLPMTPRVLRSFYFQAEELGGGDIFGPGAQLMVIVGGKPDPKFLEPVIQRGVVFVEAYGSSESGLCVATPVGRHKDGWTGTVLPFADLKFDKDGEILVRSPNSAFGYYGDEAGTREKFLPDGYVRTSDLGVMGEDGYVKILGRKRDVFGTYEGSVVFPARIESMIETLPWVDQACLVGDGMPYICAMIVLKNPELESAAADGYLDPAKFKPAYEQAAREMASLNKSLEQIERIGRIALFANRFDPEAYGYVSGAKVNRNRKVLTQKYSARVADLYAKLKSSDATCVPGAKHG